MLMREVKDEDLFIIYKCAHLMTVCPARVAGLSSMSGTLGVGPGSDRCGPVTPQISPLQIGLARVCLKESLLRIARSRRSSGSPGLGVRRDLFGSS